MNVIRIKEYKNRTTVKVLEELLEKARQGELTGLIFGARLGDWDHGIGIVGSYNDDPVSGALIAARLLKILSARADKMIKEE